MNYRIGIGYDSHRLVAGRKLLLGGVLIPFDRGLEGHSDADVLCHAIADAILGALAEGDLGRHFPPGDPRWKDIASLVILEKVMATARARRASIVNVDSTLVIEEPRIAPYISAMRAALAGALGVPADNVSVKATTNEGMDAAGRSEGIFAHAVVLMDMEE